MFNFVSLFSDLPSPDSRTMDTELITTEVTSPDPINTFSDPLPCPPSPNYPLWTGTVSMHGLETTSIIAYPVSGPVEKINIQDVIIVYVLVHVHNTAVLILVHVQYLILYHVHGFDI